MDRVFESGAAVSPPSVPSSPSSGYPTSGNPTTGVPATKPGPYWFYQVTEELRAIIAAAGITPAAGTLNQVLQALPAALASRPEMAKLLGTNGYQKLPGGLIIQWGYSASTSGAGGQSTVTFPIAFPFACVSVNITGNSASAMIGTVINFTPTTFVAVNGGPSPSIFFYIALGY